MVSSIERQRRYDLARAKRELAEIRVQEANELARAKRELAEARVNEAQSRLALSSGSRSGSVGRLDDVRSEGGTSARVDHATDVCASLPQGRMPHPAHVSQAEDPFDRLYTKASSSLTQQVVHPQPLAAAEPDAPTTEPTSNFTGVFSAARWEQPSTSSDLAELSREPPTTTTTSYIPSRPTEVMACPPQGGLPHSGVTSPPQGGLLHPNTFVLNQTTVNNEGCNFGTVTANVQNENECSS